MENIFKCPICGNEDFRYVGYKNGKPYCRLCITFKGKEAKDISSGEIPSPISLSYALSKEQIKLSNSLIDNFKSKLNTLVHAVCGSGKTEIVLGVIQYALEKGLHVGFALPRRDVAIELFMRFKAIFKKNNFALIYGGHHKKLEADMVVLTTHQLYRYTNYFDLLIIDEIDAFPFHNNEILHNFFEKSLRGNYIFLSATPSDEFVEKFKSNGGMVLELFARFHHHPLPVPENRILPEVLIHFSLIKTVNRFLIEKKQVFIFTPTIDICESTYRLIRLFISRGSFVHSKCTDRDKRIDDFRAKKTRYLVTTAVLERGVTVANLQVVVFRADHQLYNSYSLVQIAGRAGRKKDFPEGEVIFIANRKTKEMEKAIFDINKANKVLQAMLQRDTC